MRCQSCIKSIGISICRRNLANLMCKKSKTYSNYKGINIISDVGKLYKWNDATSAVNAKMDMTNREKTIRLQKQM